jgi:hypothetical protein
MQAGRPHGRRPFDISRRRWKYTFRMDLKMFPTAEGIFLFATTSSPTLRLEQRVRGSLSQGVLWPERATEV